MEFCYICGKEADKEINEHWYCTEHASGVYPTSTNERKPDIYARLKQSYQDVSIQTHHLRMLIETLGENRHKLPFPFSETEAKETMQELARAWGQMAFSHDYPEHDKWMDV